MINEPTEHPTEPTTPEPPAPILGALTAMASLNVIHTYVAGLLAGIGWHSVDLSSMRVRHANGMVVVDLATRSIRDLDCWFEAFPRSTVGARQRTRTEAGVMFGLGGLDWRLGLGELVDGVRVWVSATSFEDEDVDVLAIARAVGIVPTAVAA